jgi:hypothetical protein
VLTRDAYCALYPGFEAVVGAEFDRLTAPEAQDARRIPDAVGEVLGPYRLVEELDAAAKVRCSARTTRGCSATSR